MYIYAYIYIHIYIHAYHTQTTHTHIYMISSDLALNEQALVCLSNRKLVDASRGRTFHYKMANNVFFSDCVGLIYLAI